MLSSRAASLVSTRHARGTVFTVPARSISLWPFSSRSSEGGSQLKNIPATGDASVNLENPPTSPETVTSAAVDSTNTLPPVASADVASSLPAGVDPAAPVELLPASVVSETINNSINTVVDTINSSPGALQYGDLAALGLISWTPAGLVRWSLELINVSTGLPWFWTIVAGAVAWRLVLLPASIKTYRFSSRVALIQPQLNALIEKVQAAQRTKDVMAMQQINVERSKLFKSIGESPFGGLAGPLVQLPFTIGIFLGVRKMCLLPVEQLHDSGVSWLPDLTAADPTGVLPVVFAATMFWQVTVTASEIDLATRPMMGHIMNFIRFPGAPISAMIMASLPSGLVVSIIVTSLVTGLQALVFRVPAVRSYFGILPSPKPIGRQGLPSYKMTWRWMIDSWRERYAEAQRQAEAQTKQNKFGRGPTRRL
ncbi:hypothetical protein K435DRAFT_851805 [Dendrothele bispora CBS 962.96]|uniref:Membrane insertase YidC/Oxa/ALB C-terminal domain-containing protein n=1 Tax=Dendrothele bispora (strain CBS 962.96) TaxID=1314807 RepID=A0A4S8ML01_DENBC|nr:hypothetical protein K435DRAFT_851805 [Dendrothele bispora CBS 962.96]